MKLYSSPEIGRSEVSNQHSLEKGSSYAANKLQRSENKRNKMHRDTLEMRKENGPAVLRRDIRHRSLCETVEPKKN